MTTATCTFEGCDRARVAKGLCHTHYSQQRRGVPLTPAQPRDWHNTRPAGKRGCTFEGCERWSKAKNLCMRHYQQQRQGIPLTPLRTGAYGLCTFEGCTSAQYAKGLCRAHHAQQLRGVELHPSQPRPNRGAS